MSFVVFDHRRNGSPLHLGYGHLRHVDEDEPESCGRNGGGGGEERGVGEPISIVSVGEDSEWTQQETDAEEAEFTDLC